MALKFLSLAIPSLSIYPTLEYRNMPDGGRRLGNHLFQAILVAMDEGAVSQSRSGEILAVNPAAENVLGMATKALIGRSSADFARALNFIREDEPPFSWNSIRPRLPCSRAKRNAMC